MNRQGPAQTNAPDRCTRPLGCRRPFHGGVLSFLQTAEKNPHGEQITMQTHRGPQRKSHRVGGAITVSATGNVGPSVTHFPSFQKKSESGILFALFIVFLRGSHCVLQAGLDLKVILLPRPLRCRDYKHAMLSLARSYFLCLCVYCVSTLLQRKPHEGRF